MANDIASRVKRQVGKKKTVKLDFAPHDTQQEVVDAFNLPDTRYIVLRAGRRWGKSVLSLNLVFREALYNPGRYWIIAPEYRSAKSIYWRDLVAKYIPEPLILKKNDTELMLEIMTFVKDENGNPVELTSETTSIIEFKGSDRADSLRGAGLEMAILDEYAFQKPFVWEKIIQPMLLQSQGKAMFISTPNGVANHFHDLVVDTNKLIAEKQPGYKEWSVFHFTSYDNKTIPDVEDELDKIKAKVTEEYFAQEYLAEFTRFTGQIYKEFNDKVHIKEFEVDDRWTFYRSIDFGTLDPDAVLFIGVDTEGHIYIFDEIYMSDLYTSELSELIKNKSGSRYFVQTFADSAAKQSILDLTEKGIFATPVAKNTGEKSKSWLLATIEQVRQALKDDKITIHPRCKGLITEFRAYSWRKDRNEDLVQMPEDKNNHLLDALRYFIASYKTNPNEKDVYTYTDTVDSIVGY